MSASGRHATPRGRHEVRCERDVMIAMRDGIRLATDIYHPLQERGERARPVLIERTPYDKRGVSRSERTLANPEPQPRSDVAEFFASHGYVVVMQDVRGRYRSEGEFVKYLNEPQDGYDTLAWLVEQPWCDGRIGTMGLSYGAHTQSALATQAAPGLACMFMDSGGFANACEGGIRRGGAFEMKQVTWAYRHALRSPLTQADPARRRALEAVDLPTWFRDLPWSPGHSPLAAAPEYEAYLFEQWQAGSHSEHWQHPALCGEHYYERFPDVPVAILGSWYDPYVYTCIANFRALAARRSTPVELIMGPWTHGDRSQRHAGYADFGAAATLDGNIATDYRQLRLDWFDRHLGRGGAAANPPVRYFRMGGGPGTPGPDARLQHGGAWQHADSWPPAGSTQRRWPLSADGRLLRDGEAADGSVVLRADPADPVPTIGGAVTSGAPIMFGGAYDQRVSESTFQCRPRPAGQALAERADVLVFETQTLVDDVAVDGPVAAVLWISSDAPDADIAIKLVDVYPPSRSFPLGYAMNVCDGILRLRYREGAGREAFLTTGEICRVEIRAFDTSNLFRAGHRLRLEIAGSNYPQFDVNPNNGRSAGDWRGARVATTRIHVGPAYPSCLVLQVAGP